MLLYLTNPAPSKEDKHSQAKERLRKALGRNNPRALGAALDEFESSFEDEKIPGEDMELIQLAHIQKDNIKSKDGIMIYFSDTNLKVHTLKSVIHVSNLLLE